MKFLKFTPTPKIDVGVRLVAKILLWGLNFYQRYISRYPPSSCRFYPNCSEYAKQAILKYGLARGASIALMRLAKCHPLSRKQGFDPLR